MDAEPPGTPDFPIAVSRQGGETMKSAVTEGVYSKDSYEPNLCTLQDGFTCWTAWSAYGAAGSRAFVRKFAGETACTIESLSPNITMQTRPICIPNGDEAVFVWLEKTGRRYAFRTRRNDGNGFTSCRECHVLPASAKVWEPQALLDESGALWICWAQSEKGNSRIRILRTLQNGTSTTCSAVNGSRYNYRPRMVEWGSEGVYIVWDSYVGHTYDVYGCAVGPAGPRKAVRISCDEGWENRSSLCRDTGGALWAVWVRGVDVMYRRSTLQQKYSLRGARLDGSAWEPLTGSDGGADIAPLHYGLLTEFPKPPNLGHMGRRLFPVLKSARTSGVWLFYEAKADSEQGTLTSKGRLFGHHCKNGDWSEPLCVAEGNVFYELPHNGTVGNVLHLLSQDMITDERYLETVRLSTGLSVVPEEYCRIDLAEWKEVRLPFDNARATARPRNELPGGESGRYQLYWVDLHCHSAASIEVEGEPDELGHYARDKAQIDGLTISDNDSFWNLPTRRNVRHLKDYEWDYVKGNAMVLDEPGLFAMFPGYEMTITDRVDSGRDHRSVMSDDDEMEMDLLHFKYKEAHSKGERHTHKDTRECLAWFKEKGYLPLPHPHNGKWNLYDTDVEWGVDVCAAWMINIDLFDIYYKYLDAGHKFAFTGSGDSHHRNPGLSGALTGIWAERLDRAAILDAIRARRCYATAGQKILIEFTINDQMMGSSLVVRDDPVLKWRVVGETGRKYILRVHRDGRLMYDDRFTGRTRGERKEFRLRRYRPGKHYYHIEVLSAEPVPQYPNNVAHAMGARGWSTPIWVETLE